uniref:Flagellar hook-associated protein 1 n=1 Tax=Magnetococcus massalia (strain MO-1) TaxID=451514 RepID=A0A1S7LL78_MAGMO|nr:putative Flagellar hook-associated protein 1 (FlgK) [Candidatus Magnetococcus massalia]
MSLASLLNISKYGLLGNQYALSAVSQNIANVNTPGYSRQTAALASVQGAHRGSQPIGGGVKVEDLVRNVDDLVDSRIQAGLGEKGRLETRNRLLNMVEDVFNDRDGDGLSQRLDKFFANADKLADNPTSPASRAELVAAAQELASFVGKMHNELDGMALPVDQEVDVLLNDLNTKLKSLAEVDQSIQLRENTETQALDLKDQRDEMIREISQMIDVQQLNNADGSVTLMTAGGELLMDHGYTAEFTRGALDETTGYREIFVNGKDSDYTDKLTGGELKGLIEIRDEVVNGDNGYLTRLETIIDTLRYQVNSITSNSSSMYMHTTQEGVFNLGDELDTAISALTYDSMTPPPEDLANVASGDVTFAYGADTSNLSRTTVSITADMTLNEVVTALNASDAVNATVTSDNTLQLTAASGVYAVESDNSNILAALGVGAMFGGNGASNLSVNQTFIDDNTEVPVVRINTDADGNPKLDNADNDGVLALANLRNTSFELFGESLSISAHYASTVSMLGAEQARNEESLTAQQSAYDFMQEVRASVSGVSLEEELTDLMRYQRAFQASSKMVTTADQLLESIISMV